MVGLFNVVWNKFTGNIYPYARFVLRDLLKEGKNSAMLHVGGDTYCYGNSVQNNALVYWSKSKKIPAFLWGASIEENCMNDKSTLNSLKSYKRIYVRESLSYEILVKYGFKDVTFKTADPAFILEKSKVQLDDWWNKKIIGINLSPFAMEENKDDMLVINACVDIIDELLKNTDYNIALIPHVWKNDTSGDYIPLNILFEKYVNNPRVRLVHGNYNSSQIKYIISKCYAFLATRTHASIAAYSSFVPTLVLGYSIKSKGIATDLFGKWHDYVIPVNKIEDTKDIFNAFFDIILKHDEIKKQLECRIPEYQGLVRDAINDITDFL
ncbi:MAG: polysaccharide pyruvyl transferase family protein [bacterium]|nr:polysaccharide pyruvyl transferase family protein [bacterium]